MNCQKTGKNPVKTAVALAALFLAGGQVFAGAGREEAPIAVREPVTIMIAAAASLRLSFENELIPQFQEKYPWITVEGTYASSGQLQTQIEQGLEADLFMSAAVTQMDNLVKSGHMNPALVKPLLENKIVLIKPAGTTTTVTEFRNITQAKVIALGDPASVPAGQYAREAFTTLGIWDVVSAKASFGSNVTEVANWVAAASAEVGVVYATDAAAVKNVEIIAECPGGLLAKPVIYPLGISSASKHLEEAKNFFDFLSSSQGLAVFTANGFSPIN
ncbi:MAG: molybdate ABC transporter substrate-binding protein [Treponema sp.]|jgi:molybdate transport system substrate-binding protein|nr:molybdate ABC transporter substrate-binding protein [Treponema sp.]